MTVSARSRLQTIRTSLSSNGAGRPRTEMFLQPDSINHDTFGPSLDEVQNGKAVIFGIPKAGNVWLQSLLVDYLQVDPLETLDEVDRKGVVFTHNPFIPDFYYRTDFVHGACLIRDLRDVVVSYFHYSQTEDFRKEMTRHFYEDIETFYYDWFLSRFVPAQRLHTFAQEYAGRGIPVVRYERLRRDPAHELVRLLKRWGIDPDLDRVEAAVEGNSLPRLKRNGKDLGFKVSPTHFRAGRVGCWREELPLAIARDIDSRFEAYHRRWGYPVDVAASTVSTRASTGAGYRYRSKSRGR